MKEVFWKSKYLKTTAALLILGMLAAFAGGSIWSQDKILLPEDALKAVDGRADIVRDFDIFHVGITVLNPEKEWFAVRKFDSSLNASLQVEERDGNVLLTLDAYSGVEQKAGDYAVLSGSKNRHAILNRQTLDLMETDLTDLELHESGEYFIGADGRELGNLVNKVVSSKTGEVLYESRKRLVLPERKGFIIESPIDEADRIVSLETGEMIYTAPEGHMIEDGADGMWLMNVDGIKYLRDDAFQVMLDGTVFGDASVEGDMVFGQAITDWGYDQLAEQTEGLVTSYKARVYAYSNRGEQLYSAEPGIEYQGSMGNIMVLYDGQKDCYIYEYMKADGVYETRTTEGFFCYMDEEDGYMLACTPKLYSGQRVRPKDSQIRRDIFPADFKWGYVNLSMEETVPFVFDEASFSENGYAVVYTEENYTGLIDLLRRESLQ